eukprot:jgi/Picsp_1/2106/NSC_05571-R1_uncharacterized aarf domain-containing protein kinase chloroplastic-like
MGGTRHAVSESRKEQISDAILGQGKDNDDSWFFTETGQKSLVDAMELSTLSPEIPALLGEMGHLYDPDKLAEVLSQRPTFLTARAITIASALGGIITGILADIASGSFESNAKRRAEQLRSTLARLGPSFVKVGQALSSRPDLLPKPYLDGLATLQDRLDSFPTPVAMTVIEEELGRPVDEIYSYISKEPVAAASLGQVYKGVLRSTGEQVAIKVQRPAIGEGIAVDMVLLRRLMMLIDTRLDIISQPLVPLVDEFAARLFGELDYVQEGKNCEKFARLYSHVPRVSTPEIKWEATSRRVLTMEWIEGVKLTNKEAMASAGLDVVDFVTVGVECTLRQLLEAGFFHADPHPGNLLATTGGDLVYLDFGMMSEAPRSARHAIIAHVVHLVNRDYLAMCYDYYTLDFMDSTVDTTPIAPALAEFFDEVLSDSTVSRLNFRTLVDGLGGVLFQYPFKVPAYYALILRSLTVLEGLALSADPQYNLLGAAYPYVAKRLLTDPAPELRTSLEDLILEDGRLRWQRLENLVREGSKSQDFDPSQIWTLVEWICSESGKPVRKPLAREVVRLIDSFIVERAREVASRQFGRDQALEFIPETSEEVEARKRGLLVLPLLSNLMERATGTPLDTSFARFDGFNPTDIASAFRMLRKVLSSVEPRFQSIFQRSGAQELLVDVQLGLVQRAIARGIKLAAAITNPSLTGQNGLQE